MNIQELTYRAKESAKKRTPKERTHLLIAANILDDEGNFLKEYFSEATINKHNKGN